MWDTLLALSYSASVRKQELSSSSTGYGRQFLDHNFLTLCFLIARTVVSALGNNLKFLRTHQHLILPKGYT